MKSWLIVIFHSTFSLIFFIEKNIYIKKRKVSKELGNIKNHLFKNVTNSLKTFFTILHIFS